MENGDRAKKKPIRQIESLRRKIAVLESENARLAKIIESAGRLSHEMSQRYLDLVHTIVVELDASGTVVQINKRGCEILGCNETEILDRNWFDNFLPEYMGPEVKSVFNDLIAGKFEGQEFFENPIRTRDGEERLIAWHNIILKDPDGRISGTLSSGLDITEEFYATVELKSSKEKFREIFDKMMEAFALHEIICDEKGRPVDYRFLEINPAFEKMTGLDQSIIGKNVKQVLPDIEKFWIDTYGKVALTGKSERFENYSRDLGRYYEVIAFSPEKMQFATLFYDITDYKKSEQKIARSNKNLNEFMNSVPDSVHFVDRDLKITELNKAALSRINRNKEEVLGADFLSIYPFLKEMNKDRIFKRVLKNGISETDEDIYHHPELGDIYLIITVFKVGDGLGIIATDVTSSRAAEIMLRESEEKFRKFSEAAEEAVIIHDGNVIHETNQAGARMFGYEYSEMIGMPLGKLATPESLKLIEKNIVEEYESPYEACGIKKDGTPITGIITGKQIKYKGEDLRVVTILDITDRRRAEDAIRESEARYQELFSSVMEGIGFADPEDNIRFCNPAFARMLGFTDPEKLVGKNLRDFVHEDDIDLIIAETEKRKRGESSRYELRIITAEGKTRTVLAFISPNFDDGKYAGTFGTILDITDRKKAEEALQQSEERYRAVWENSPSGICLTDRDGIYQYVNPAYCRIYGFTEGQLIGQSFFDMIIPDNVREERSRLYRERFDISEPIPIGEGEFQKSDGQPVTVQFAGDFVKMDGNTRYMVSINIDVTEHRRAETLLKESEEIYRTLIEQSNDAIFLLVDGRLGYVNRRLVEMFGYSEEELYSPDIDLLDLVAPSNREMARNLLSRIAAGEDIPAQHELRALDKDGNEMDIEVSVSNVTYKGKKAIQGIIHDSTEKKALEAQLMQSQKMESIGRLAGGVAHDFNNLLTAITGHTELAKMQVKEHDPLMEDIRTIQKAADRASDLTLQLLAFSRKQTLAPRILNLNTIIENMGSMLKRIIGEDISLQTVAPDDLWAIKVDPGQIEQVIINLAVNARDAMPLGGILSIETSNVEIGSRQTRSRPEMLIGQYVLLSVKDSGTGIPAKIKEKIFEPFFTTKDMGKGTGLGLSTVYGIIKQSEGHIEVQSKVDKGTTFNIYLPRVEGVAEPIEIAGESDEVPSGSETILLVEDDKIVRDIAVKTLKRCGYTVIDAASGGDAFLICEKMKTPIDLIITDIIMPNMGGTVLADRLRKIWPDLKVLFISGYTNGAFVDLSAREPGIPYLQKPFRPVALATKVRKVLDSD